MEYREDGQRGVTKEMRPVTKERVIYIFDYLINLAQIVNEKRLHKPINCEKFEIVL
jgi:hypothetical protein